MDDMRKMNTASESDESLMATTSDTNSPTVEDVQNEENAMQGNAPLKKGSWTASEDAILVEYVRTNGEGNWNTVQRKTGLARCGKSCRLRWTNHLKPDLKKGAFTPEEEMLIIRLQAQMGNKWARISAELPGRTDNEIKNFWNARDKKRKRKGLDIHPSDEVNGPSNPPASIEGNNPPLANEADEIPLIRFKVFDPNQYILTMSGFPWSTSMPRDVRSLYTNKGPLVSNACPPVRLCGSGPVSPWAPRPLATQIPSGGYPQIQENPGCSSGRVITSPSSVFLVSHALKNGGIACSSELPSLQKQNGRWDFVVPSAPPLPPFESNDVSSLTFEEPIGSTRSNGLVDEVVRGSSQANAGFFHGSLQANGGLLDDANGGLSDLIFPEVNLDGLEMPAIDDDDDLFLGVF